MLWEKKKARQSQCPWEAREKKEFYNPVEEKNTITKSFPEQENQLNGREGILTIVREENYPKPNKAEVLQAWVRGGGDAGL